MEIWADGRSGASGRLVGNVALRDMSERTRETIKRRKGTEFESRQAIYCGRSCGTDAYLHPGVRHWANLSRAQHGALVKAAQDSGRQLLYLFVTGTKDGSEIEYWVIPAKVVDDIFANRGGETVGVHLVQKNGSYQLLNSDVGRYRHVVTLRREQTAELRRALESDAEASGASVTTESPAAPVSPPVGGLRHFEIPLSGARYGRLEVPLPLQDQDIDRIKKFVDLVSDVLKAG